MNLKKNITANLASQLYVTAINIVIVPLYLHDMGAEAFGLIGFFAMLQAWFNLLETTLSAVVIKETAQYRAEIIDAKHYRAFIFQLEKGFLLIAILGSCGLFLLAPYFAVHWLNAKQLSLSELTNAIQLMGLSIALRWQAGLYRNIVSGSEQFVWLNAYNAGIATLRFIGALAVLRYISVAPSVFFGYQCVVALVELIGLVQRAYRFLPSDVFRWKGNAFVIKKHAHFSLQVGFANLVWLFATQVDKLLLSKQLSLADYGYFSLAVLIASSVMVLARPITSAILPRMALLHAQNESKQFIQLYRHATQLTSALVGTAALSIAFLAKPLVAVWTGDEIIAQHIADTVIYYALGNGLAMIACFPYYLQYAKGQLQSHFICNVVFITFLVGSFLYACSYGGKGTGLAWLISNSIYFLLYTYYVHHKYFKRLHWHWLMRDVCSVIMPVLIFYQFITPLLTWEKWQRFDNLIQLIIVGFIALTLALFTHFLLKKRD